MKDYTLIKILIVISCLLYASGLSISWQPFALKFRTPLMGLAILFLLLSYLLYGFHNYRIGKKEVLQEMKKEYGELKNSNHE